MTTTTFEPWLAELAAAGKGPVRWRGAVRGQASSHGLMLDGDWTGSAMTAHLRLAPDTPGAPLVEFAVTGPAYDGPTDTTLFTFTLAAGAGANSTGVLPVDADGSGTETFALFAHLTPPAAPQEMLLGGTFNLLGA